MTAVNVLSFEAIKKSSEIQNWLNQFGDAKSKAIHLLMNLHFVPRDFFADYILRHLKPYSEEKCALYAVRKYKGTAKSAWTKSGKVNKANAITLGSEDLVRSVISNALKMYPDCFSDHPSVAALKKEKIRKIILLDDSIGSGDRVARYIKLFLQNQTLMSWWSYGKIKFIVLSYASTIEAQKRIIEGVPGSNHGLRTFPTSKKLIFDCEKLYDASNLQRRWGDRYAEIYNLCASIKKIPRDRRFGYGDVMGNIVFYHSVPNNVPGVLFRADRGWNPLCPGRSFPEWLENTLIPKAQAYQGIPYEAISFLQLVAKGVRNPTALGRRLDLDRKVAVSLLLSCKKMGLVSDDVRLTKAGQNFLFSQKALDYKSFTPDYSLYIPSCWCC